MTMPSKPNSGSNLTLPHQWRFIPLIEASGATQMAIDRWLFQQHITGNAPPTLRFYTWNPVAISLGYHQHQYPEFWQQLKWQGEAIELVRRPTGGRAVLHQGDLTYMVVVSGLSGTRSQTYQQICSFLISGWRSLGINLHYGQAGRGYIKQASCFSSATSADLVTESGYKFIGSAQYRQGNAILQHGAIALSTNRGLYQQVFAQLPIGFSPDREWHLRQIIATLKTAAKDCFDIELMTQPLSALEREAAEHGSLVPIAD
ncbi:MULTISPECIES: lipoate--protein ligase family protein [Spirulina sp. CCY15215]|uniref:lipoate--protein ligase family protein n=1 Tax=Spirulina sp. CCY15215 TaxID=2767591 RepID=UPI001EF390BF|nr:lipoate--protein ligase family protein [Spirulina major]